MGYACKPNFGLNAQCCWAESAGWEVQVMGLGLGDTPLLPLWVWLYCLAWWIVQVTEGVGWLERVGERGEDWIWRVCPSESEGERELGGRGGRVLPRRAGSGR